MRRTKKHRAESEDVYCQGIVTTNQQTGLREVHICLGAKRIGRLEDGIWAGFQQYIVDEHLKRSDFGGKVVFVILGEVTPQSPALWRAMTELEEHLKAVVAAGKLKTVTGRHIEIEFTYTSSEDTGVQ